MGGSTWSIFTSTSATLVAQLQQLQGMGAVNIGYYLNGFLPTVRRLRRSSRLSRAYFAPPQYDIDGDLRYRWPSDNARRRGATARIDWLIAGKSSGNCNCDDGGLCQLENPPTDGGCSAITTNGAIAFTLKVSDAQFNRFRHSGGSVIH